MKRAVVWLVAAFIAFQIYMIREAVAAEVLFLVFLLLSLLLVGICYVVGSIFEGIMELISYSTPLLKHARRGLCFGWSVLSESCTNGFKKLDW